MALSKILENSITDGVVSSAKLKDFAAAVDLNGVELILDADQDTSITADTDDRIDFKIANVEHFSFSNSSGDTVVKPMVDGKDIIFQQYDGNKILEINDGNYVGIGGNAAGAGEIRIYEDTDNGNHYTGFKAGNNTASVAYVLPTADGSSGQGLTTDGSGTLSWSTLSANTPTSADGQALGSASLEWSDLYLADSSVIYFGADQDVTLTHNPDTGLTLNTVFAAASLDISGNIDVDGTTNLDAVDIDGAVQLDATLTVGANDQGYDVILYGDTASANVTWDTSADDLIFNGAAGLIVPDGQLTLGSTAVTSTAAELNLLDGVSGLVQADLTKLAAVDSTAAELNIVDGGTSATSTTLADADRLVVNDNGTMVQVALTDFETYFESALDTLSNVTTVGALNSGSITSGFGSIDNGSSAITTTGTITGGVVVADDVSIDGKAITMTGSSSDTFVITVGTDGATSLVTMDAAAAAANMTITADGTMEIDGTTITLDSSGDIVLDADGADIIFKDGGTTIATHTNSSSDYVITTGVQDKDFVIKGNDGGSTITPFTLDMSAGGDLFLTGGLIDLKNDGSAVSQIKFYCESSNAHAQTLIGAPHSESATNTLTLPSTGGNSYLVSAASTATLTNKTLTSPQITTSIIPSSADGATIGSASAEFSDLYLADSSVIYFGLDQDVTITHNPDAGLTFKRTATGDNSYPIFNFHTGETNIEDNELLGVINFAAPDEAAGTDAVTVAASIYAKAEADFTSSVNKTKLVFQTATSGPADDAMVITNDGHVRSKSNAFAWANIGLDNVAAGNSTPGGALNISTVTLQSTGVARFNYTNAASSTNVAAVTTHNTAGGTANWNNSTSSYIQFTYYHSNGSVTNASGVNMVSFGGQ